MNKPYVVSWDIISLLTKWAEVKNFTLPAENFFSDLRVELVKFMSGVFPYFEFISEKELSLGAKNLISNMNLPIISLDRVYFKGDYHIDLTRSVDENGFDIGLHHRVGSPTLTRQLRQLSGINEVCLVDDVIFSGVLIERVINLLSHLGINVPIVCAGIGIQEGINRITTSSRSIYCVKTYRDVVDEVCERDFYLGVPFSGRLINNSIFSMPYFLPFGKPEWASISGKYQKSFSKFCIQQSICLFEEIEKSSGGKIVKCEDIERKIIGMNTGSFVEFLKSIPL